MVQYSPVFGTGIIPGSNSAYAQELAALTRRAFIRKLIVQIYQAAPSLALALRNAQKASGGMSSITAPVQGASYVNFGWTDISGSFQQPVNQQASQDAAWNMSLGVVPIPLLGVEALVQSTEAVIPRMKAVMADAKTVAIQALSSAFFGSQGGNPLAMNGLLDAYDDGTNVGTYGGLSRSANPFWKSNRITTAIAPSRNTILTRIVQLTKLAGGEAPDMVIMSMGDWTTLVTDFMQAEQFQSNPEMKYGMDDAINAGFRAVMVGQTPILADPFCPTGTAFLINSRYLAMYLHENANFAFSGFYSNIPNNQISMTGVLLMLLNLVCTKPVSGMQLTNLTGAPF